jgi:hypothetical protein
LRHLHICNLAFGGRTMFAAWIVLAMCDTAMGQAVPTSVAAPLTFTIGGYFKPQANFDFNPAGNTDFWDPRTIPVDGSTGQNFRIHARDTRLSLDVRGPVEAHELRLFVETDFAEGSGYTLRVRHAYGSWGPVLAGQTWSTFVDELIIPKTIDLEPPMTFPFLRVAQLRLTTNLNSRATWAIAIEDPSHTLDIPPDLNGKEEHPMPDITGRLRWSEKTWHTQVSGFVGMVRFRPDSGGSQQRGLWGVALSGQTSLGASDTISGQVTVGDGVGRFRGGTVAAFDDTSTLRPVAAVGVVASYDHAWSVRFTSNASYGWATVDTDGQRTADPTRSGTYATMNLLWWFLPARAWFGGEYLFGRREVDSGATGQANRIQFAFKFFIQ